MDDNIIPDHTGNDCYVNEFLDESAPSTSSDANQTKLSSNTDYRRRRVYAADSEYTVLKNPGQIPEQFDGYVGYRMKLFALKYKSAPSHVVKSIERVKFVF